MMTKLDFLNEIRRKIASKCLEKMREVFNQNKHLEIFMHFKIS